MCHMKPSERKSSSSSGKESGNWTLVDEGGEEVQQRTYFFFFPFVLFAQGYCIVFVKWKKKKPCCSVKMHNMKLSSILLFFYLSDTTVDSGASKDEY